MDKGTECTLDQLVVRYWLASVVCKQLLQCDDLRMKKKEKPKFSQVHKDGNNDTNAIFVMSYICIYLFSSSLAPDGVSKYEIIYQWILDVCSLTFHSWLVLIISDRRIKTSLQYYHFCTVESLLKPRLGVEAGDEYLKYFEGIYSTLVPNYHSIQHRS